MRSFIFRALPLPACFTTEQSTVEASLFVKQSKTNFSLFGLWFHVVRSLLVARGLRLVASLLVARLPGLPGGEVIGNPDNACVQTVDYALIPTL